MEEQLRLNYMRRAYSIQGAVLMIYYAILNAAVIVVMVGSAIRHMFNGEMDEEQLTALLMNDSGWGYLIAIGVGSLILLLWKKPTVPKKELWKRGKPMTIGSFFAVLSLAMSCQLIFTLLDVVLEWLFNGFGYSLQAVTESVSNMGDGLAMFLYVGLGAPISEEILFRGVIMRSMEPFGKKSAIFFSALLFGIFHGNLIQSPYAFGVGLVLGYVAMEYSIFWAMVLHMFNNLILSDTLARLTADWRYPMADYFLWAIIIGFTIAAVAAVIIKRKEIAAYFQTEHDDPLCKKAFFTAPGIIAVLVIMLASMVIALMTTITPI